MRFWKYLELDSLRPPELICFDHLYSEYLTLKLGIKDDAAVAFIEELSLKVEKEDEERKKEVSGGRKENKEGAEVNKKNSLSWNDLYYFELILADHLPVEKLRSKIVRLRSDYRSIASEKEFGEYLGSKPPDLQSPPEPTDPPDATPAHYDKLLREDLKDLLGRIYMKYAILPVREKRLTDLTLFAARLCFISLAILLGILLVIFFVQIGVEISEHDRWVDKLRAFMDSGRLASLTIFVVVVTGAMGGFVSALQRIQSPPTEGDSLYNLSLLFHGSKSVFVAPITGAIFATLLYLMFTASLLTGTFFPTIYTPETFGPRSRSSSNSNTSAEIPVRETDSNSNVGNTQTDTNSASNSAGARPAAKADEPAKGLNVFDFLARSGPHRGKDYALLIIWCFIAGFAERFVPDALDRLISNSKSNGKK